MYSTLSQMFDSTDPPQQANVLVSDDGHARLTDFGSCCLTEVSLGRVIKGDLQGTLDWMAPEHLNADKFTMSTTSDVWAFGMTTLVSCLSTLPVITHKSVSRNYLQGNAHSFTCKAFLT